MNLFRGFNRIPQILYNKGNKCLYQFMNNIVDDPIAKSNREQRISLLKQEIREVKWLFKNGRHDEFHKWNPIGSLQGMEAALSDMEAVHNRTMF